MISSVNTKASHAVKRLHELIVLHTEEEEAKLETKAKAFNFSVIIIVINKL